MTDIQESHAELSKILATMDVPKLRLNDRAWLSRNLGVRNGEHPDFQRAMSLIRDIQQGLRCHAMFDGNPE